MNSTKNSRALGHYADLMAGIRSRFDVVSRLQTEIAAGPVRTEIFALNCRKIVEATAFACLAALENGIQEIPRSAAGQWNAKKILNKLERQGLAVWPSPSVLRRATPDEQALHNVTATIEGVPDCRLSVQEVLDIYQRQHGYLHEQNPYRSRRSSSSDIRLQQIDSDIAALRKFLSKHAISIQGKMFYAVLWDSVDNQTKVVPLDSAIGQRSSPAERVSR